MSDVMAGPGWYIVEFESGGFKNVKEGPFEELSPATEAAREYLNDVRVMYWNGKKWSTIQQ